MQANNAPYLIYEMQHIEGMSTTAEQDKIATMKWSFLITSIVSINFGHLSDGAHFVSNALECLIKVEQL
jgi:hypothetical protein